jgi:hypothetical protein
VDTISWGQLKAYSHFYSKMWKSQVDFSLNPCRCSVHGGLIGVVRKTVPRVTRTGGEDKLQCPVSCVGSIGLMIHNFDCRAPSSLWQHHSFESLLCAASCKTSFREPRSLLTSPRPSSVTVTPICLSEGRVNSAFGMHAKALVLTLSGSTCLYIVSYSLALVLQ